LGTNVTCPRLCWFFLDGIADQDTVNNSVRLFVRRAIFNNYLLDAKQRKWDDYITVLMIKNSPYQKQSTRLDITTGCTRTSKKLLSKISIVS
jgi:hypothetical protein